MPVTHAIAYRLTRRPDSSAELQAGEELAGADAAAALLDELKGSFLSRIAREHGSFSEDGEQPAPLAQALVALEAGQSDFAQLGRTLLEALRERIETAGAAVDVRWLLFLDEPPGHRRLYLFGTQTNTAPTLTDDLTIATCHPLDTGAGLFGIKVDLGEWREQAGYAYLSFLPPRGNAPLAQAFREVTGFGEPLDTAEQTNSFLEGVEAFARQMPDEDAGRLREQVVEYCMEQERADEPLDLTALAARMEGVDGERLVETVDRHCPDGREDLRLDRRSLRRYVRFAGRERDLSVSFSSHQLNQRIKYDPHSDTLSINGLPQGLRDQLLAHIKGG